MFNRLLEWLLKLFNKNVPDAQYALQIYEQGVCAGFDLVATRSQKLEELVKTWEHRARCKFISAELEKDVMGKKLIQHGAFCYFNCAQEIKEALAAPSPREQEHLSEDQR